MEEGTQQNSADLQHRMPWEVIPADGAAHSTASRPWQGTLLAILCIVGFVLMNLSGFYVPFPVMAAMFIANVAESPISAAFGLLFFALDALLVLIVIGLFRGWGWVATTAFVLGVLLLVSSLFSRAFFGTVFIGYLLWLANICRKDTFYNQR